MANNLLDKSSIILTPTAYNNGEALCVKPSDGSGDFQFSRNSAATRVNAQGLVENVQILSSNLVQNGDFSEEGVQEVSNGSFSQEGVEEITNGDFSNGETDWDFVSTSELTEQGARIYTPDGSYTIVVQNNVLVVGKQYKVTFDVIATDGSSLSNGSGSVVYDTSTIGSKVFYITTDEAGFALKRISGITDVTITNISVREVGQDWTLGTGWSIGEDKAVCDGTNNADITQVGSIVGKTYKATLSVSENNVGRVNVYIGGTFAGQTTNGATGDFTFYATATDTNLIRIRSNNSFNGSITNISVKEVLQDWTATNSVISNPNNQLKVDDTQNLGSDSRASQTISTTSGKSYKLTFDRISTTSSFWLAVGSGNPNPYVDIFRQYLGTDTGVYELEFIAISSTTTISLMTGGTGISVFDNVTCIEVTTDTSLPRINYEGFSYQDALGSELVVNGDFSNGSANWTFTNVGGSNGWRISNSKAICDTIGVANGRNLNSSTSLVSGKSYKVTLDILQSDDNISILIGSTTISNAFPIGTNLGVSYIINSSQHSGGIFSLYAGSSDLQEIDNVSVKEYLGQSVVPDSGCGSWLWEPQTTQLLPNSEAFSQWGKGADITIEGGYLAPDGNNTAYKVTKTGISTPYLTDNRGLTATTTRSIFARTISGTGTATLLSHNSNTNNTFTLTEQWQRFELSDTASSTGLTTFYAADFRGSGTLTEYLIWGANATNDQDYATSYIPSNGSQVTRNQDLCINGGSLASINSTEGVLYAEIAALANDGTLRMIVLNDGTQSNRVGLQYSSTNNLITAAYDIGGAGQASLNYTLTDAKSFNKIAFKYKQNDFSLYVNGIEVATDVSGNVLPANTLNNFEFEYGDNRFFFYGKTKALAVWKEALSDQELTELTTI